MSGAAQRCVDAEPLDGGSSSELPLEQVRADFPALAQQIHGRPLVYLDNAASTQKPRQVIEAISGFYSRDFANIHRGSHSLSNRATEAYEKARATVARFISARQTEEIVFVRNCTEAINLVAWSWAAPRLGQGDEVLVSQMEHHSNLVPWQEVCARTGARLKVAPIDERGQLDLEALNELLSGRTRVVAITHMSNVLGTVVPLASVIARAHAVGAVVVVDGAQGIVHERVDVSALDCDFYAFSGHKLYGPTGIGVLYGKRELLETMPPYQTGGGMVDIVEQERSTFLPAPLRFEAGTPNVAGAIGLAAAIDYLASLGRERVAQHERRLARRAGEALSALPGLRLIGTAPGKGSVISFVLDQAHPSDISMILDQQGVAIRAGHHCAQPLMRRFGVAATARASFALYNTADEIDALVAGMKKVIALCA